MAVATQIPRSVRPDHSRARWHPGRARRPPRVQSPKETREQDDRRHHRPVAMSSISSTQGGRRPRMLMLAQLPPPVHGAAVMSRLVADSAVLNAAFDLLVEPMPEADRLEDLRRFSLSKAWRGLKFLAIVGRRLCGSRRPDLVYLTFS